MKKQKTTPDVSCETFSKILKEVFSGTGVTINQEQCDKMYRFWEMLLRWNSVHNLTSVTDTRTAIFTHFADSLLPLLVTDLFERRGRILDFGTGGGFPGIPLAIMSPNPEFFLLDKMHKKISFLQIASAELCLNNVFPVCSDIKTIEGRYAAVLSRAVNINEDLFAAIKTKIERNGCFISFLSGSQEPLEIKEYYSEHKFDFLPVSGKIVIYRF
jgi:16S rRNA (guanine527-N7)-methyltransferase